MSSVLKEFIEEHFGGELRIVIAVDQSGAQDLSEAFAEYLESSRDKSSAELPTILPIPLFITTDLEVSQKAGFLVPSEFVISAWELLEGLKTRICQLRSLHPNGLDRKFLRAFCVGAFRRFLYLDDDNHGLGEMDPTDLEHGSDRLKKWRKEDEKDVDDKWPAKILGRLDNKSDLKSLYEVSKKVFETEFEKLRNVTIALENKLNSNSNEHAAEAKLFTDALPRFMGECLRFTIPCKHDDGAEKLRVLMIDDDKRAIEALKRSRPPDPIGNSELGFDQLFSFELKILPDGSQEMHVQPTGADLIRMIKEDRKQIDREGRKNRKDHFPDWARQFDFILLDLRFGANRALEPAGFSLLPVLRKFFPDIPIIVDTAYGDIRHVRTAFARDASWFINKRSEWKLPAHLLQLREHPQWKREWNTVKSTVVFETIIPEIARERDQYLIWKCLESTPGSTIKVKLLAGGIGGALTIWASRKVKGDFNHVAPAVIKIDERFALLMERERYRRFIAPYLNNGVGRIENEMARGGSQRAAIAYTHAGSNRNTRGGDAPKAVVSLRVLLEDNLAGSDAGALPFSEYRDLFKNILSRVLPCIHDINPQDEPSEPDYPNSIFEEWHEPLNSYLMRLPPEAVLDVTKPLSFPTDKGAPEALSVSAFRPHEVDSFVATVYGMQLDSDKSAIRVLVRLDDGLLHRVDLEGNLASFYVNHRHLRPHQTLLVSGTSKIIQREEQIWRCRWTQSDAKGEGDAAPQTQSNLFEDGYGATFAAMRPEETTKLNDPGLLAKRIINLRQWLVGKDGASKFLRSGRPGIVHGDMNLGNIMVERHGRLPKALHDEPWLIDFARSRRDRIVHDFTVLEVDLCCRLLRPEFFPSAASSTIPIPLTAEIDDYFETYIRAPWQIPAVAEKSRRLRFIFECMRSIRDAANAAEIEDKEYLFSRCLQLLITHKIYANQWRRSAKKKLGGDPNLRFTACLSLSLAFDCAKYLEWDESHGSA